VATKRPDGPVAHQYSGDGEQISVVTPRFRLVFISVLVLTISLLILDVVLVLIIDNPDPEAQNLMDLCSRLATIGFGAIIGLLGGKAT
jgi:hypothetical protein